MLGIFLSQTYIETIQSNGYVTAARESKIPSSSVLADHIRARLGDDAVLLTTRLDLIYLEGFYGFIPWSAHYAHPAAEFHARLRVLKQLEASNTPDEFFALANDNPYGVIDGFVLEPIDEMLVFNYTDDNFPAGARQEQLRFDRSVFGRYELIEFGEHVLAVPRP